MFKGAPAVQGLLAFPLAATACLIIALEALSGRPICSKGSGLSHRHRSTREPTLWKSTKGPKIANVLVRLLECESRLSSIIGKCASLGKENVPTEVPLVPTDLMGFNLRVSMDTPRSEAGESDSGQKTKAVDEEKEELIGRSQLKLRADKLVQRQRRLAARAERERAEDGHKPKIMSSPTKPKRSPQAAGSQIALHSQNK